MLLAVAVYQKIIFFIFCISLQKNEVVNHTIEYDDDIVGSPSPSRSSSRSMTSGDLGDVSSMSRSTSGPRASSLSTIARSSSASSVGHRVSTMSMMASPGSEQSDPSEPLPRKSTPEPDHRESGLFRVPKHPADRKSHSDPTSNASFFAQEHGDRGTAKKRERIDKSLSCPPKDQSHEAAREESSTAKRKESVSDLEKQRSDMMHQSESLFSSDTSRRESDPTKKTDTSSKSNNKSSASLGQSASLFSTSGSPEELQAGESMEDDPFGDVTKDEEFSKPLPPPPKEVLSETKKNW